MEVFNTEWLSGDWRLVEYMVFHLDKPIGVLNPSIIFGIDEITGQKYIQGINGLIDVEENTPNGIWAAIAESGCILFGEAEEDIRLVNSILSQPETSRTFAYLCCLGKSCEDLVGFYDKIGKAKLIILGCGGIGSLSSILLCGTGLKNLLIVDHDKIEKSNLNRQILYSLEDVGHYKVDILKKRIEERYSNTQIQVIKEKIDVDFILSRLSEYDIVLNTMDEPITITKELYMKTDDKKAKIVSAGYLLDMAKILFNPSQEKMSNIKFFRGLNSIAPSSGPINAELAGLASALVIQIICGIGPDSVLLMFDSTKLPRLNIVN